MEEKDCPNQATYNAIKKCESHLRNHYNIYVGISGGADSDIVLDLLEKVRKEKRLDGQRFDNGRTIHYIFFDTGIEYQATKNHLDELEEKYNIKIERIRANVPVPLGCKEFGLPFIEKYVSEMINRLQKHNFDWVNDGNKSFEELLELYPNCKTALLWWCNKNKDKDKKKSKYNIKNHYALKEFLIAYPPEISISQECCYGAKKSNAYDYVKLNNCDLTILGVRQNEGGIRSTNIQGCFTQGKNGSDIFRLIWWFSNKDKAQYKKHFCIKNSDCYEKYGLTRTGCAGCPLGSRWEEELKIIKQYEPKLYNAVWNIFKDSYEYTRKYRQYVYDKKHGILDGQMTIFDKIGEVNYE